jgi:heme/copper-type cytochrome/quinol oxidase subunit 2
MINGENLNNIASNNTASDNTASVVAGADSIMLAQNGPSQGSNRLQNPLGTNGTLTGFLNKLLDVIIMLGSIVIVFMIILAGLRYVLARGNDSEIQKAHMQLTWTAIGAAVLLGAKVISMVIANTVRSLSQ